MGHERVCWGGWLGEYRKGCRLYQIANGELQPQETLIPFHKINFNIISGSIGNISESIKRDVLLSDDII